MSVTTHQPVTVIDLKHFTIRGMNVGVDDLAAGGGFDRRTDLGRKVDPFMKAFLTRERIEPPTEVGREPSVFDRRECRKELLVGRIVDQQRFENAELIGSFVDLTGELREQRAELAD